MSVASPQETNRSFMVLLQLMDIAVAAHSRGDEEVRNYALEELEDLMRSYRLRNVLSVLGNHM